MVLTFAPKKYVDRDLEDCEVFEFPLKEHILPILTFYTFYIFMFPTLLIISLICLICCS